MDVGARAQLYLWDSYVGACVAAGEWSAATVDSSGSVVLVATLHEQVLLQGGHVYSVRFQGQAADGSSVSTWGIEGPHLSSTPYDSGSFVSFLPLPLS